MQKSLKYKFSRKLKDPKYKQWCKFKEISFHIICILKILLKYSRYYYSVNLINFNIREL